MNPPEMPANRQTLGALVVAASKSILPVNDTTQASSTEDTIAEDMSDASQNTLDGVADANTSTSVPQFASFSTLKTPPEIPGVSDHGVTSCDAMHHKNGYTPIGNEDGNNRKKDHKKRSKNWSVLETLKLIKARAELDERFRSSGRKAALWDQISQVLHKADVSRDGQQCKDKWEKLTAGYKEVREGAREKEDLQFYKEIHQIFSCKQESKENGFLEEGSVEASKAGKAELGNGHMTPNWTGVGPYASMQDVNAQNGQCNFSKKRKRDSEFISSTDISIVQELLVTILTTQQHLFKDLLDAVEKKEQLREQIRQQREELWRAEERAQRMAFNNTMVILTERLLGERPLGVATPIPAPTTALTPMVSPANGFGSSKKRSKNWKRTEVFQLIRFRKEMEMKFAKSSRRAGLWDEVGDRLASLGIKRDGKQCREKWDKLMAGYKDVVDGRRDKDESPYYKELSIYMDMIKELKNSAPQQDASKEEYVEA
eukprot:c15585_g1_i1 orf=504-1961(+)